MCLLSREKLCRNMGERMQCLHRKTKALSSRRLFFIVAIGKSTLRCLIPEQISRKVAMRSLSCRQQVSSRHPGKLAGSRSSEINTTKTSCFRCRCTVLAVPLLRRVATCAAGASTLPQNDTQREQQSTLLLWSCRSSC